MGSSVPLRTDFDATRLRGFARKCGDNRQIRRLPPLAAVYDGMTRTEAAKVDGVVRWRQIDLVGIIKERFGVVCSDSAVANYQSELGFSYISGRPQHPAQDPKIIDGFKKTSPERSLHM